jgi:hypothetical protein
MGRVSPRKFSGQSEKSASSPRPSPGQANVDQADQDIVKKEGADDDDDAEPGNVPAMIEEGEEPPHATVLPT